MTIARRMIGSVQIMAVSLTISLTVLTLASSPRPSYLPDPKLTPGQVYDTNDNETCDPGYASRVRHVTEGQKKTVFARHGIPWTDHDKYEVDHLIPLSVGGSNDIANLWPEPWEGPWNAHMKDRLEYLLFRKVCRGEMPVAEAQRAFASDWTVAYRKYLGDPAALPPRGSVPGEGTGEYDTEGFPVTR